MQAKAAIAAVARGLNYTVPIIHDVQGNRILKKAQGDHRAGGVRVLDHVIKALLRGAHDHLLDIAGHAPAAGNDEVKGGIVAQCLRASAHLGQDGIQLGLQALIGPGELADETAGLGQVLARGVLDDGELFILGR